jgi:hypothetical protein
MPLSSFIEFLIAAALITISAGVAAHLGFAALKSTRLATLAQYEGVVQAFIFAVFSIGVLAVHAVRVVRMDIELLKPGARERPRGGRTRPLSLHGDQIMGRGVH